MMISASAPIYSLLFWKSYVVQMRPYLLFVSGVAGLAGMAASPDFSLHYWKIYVGFIPFFLGYGFGQALTDCFQTDTDQLSAPYRPLSRGLISVRQTLLVSSAGLLLCAIILFLLNIYAFLLSLLSVFGLATYSKIKKNYSLLGPFYNAWIVALLPLMGYLALTDRVSLYSLPQIWQVSLISFFSYSSFVLIGYLKDIDADRATHYQTFPVVWGWRRTIYLGDLFAIITISLFWLYINNNVAEILFGLIATIITLYGQWKGHTSKQKDEKDALLPILATVRSFILFHLAIVIHFLPYVWSYALPYYVLFELFLSRRPSKHQV